MGDKPVMRAFIVTLAFIIAILALGVALVRQAGAHSWYSGRKDPVSGYGCCGGSDCNVFKAETGKTIFPEAEGYRIKLTLEEARAVNPDAMFPVDALVKWDRVQASETSDWNICIYATNRSAPNYGVICLFEPPNS